MASPRRSLKMNGRAGRDKNFFQMSASRLQSKERLMSRPERQRPPRPAGGPGLFRRDRTFQRTVESQRTTQLS